MFTELQRALGKLFEAIKAIPDFPLVTLALHGAHPAFSSTSVFAPVRADKSSFAHAGEPLQCLLEFERSNKWPMDNSEAIDLLKSAFYLRLARGLEHPPADLKRQREEEGVAAGEAGLPCTVAREYLDVLVDGFVLRLSIFHARQIPLLLKAPPTESRGREMRITQDLLSRHVRLVRAYASAHRAYAAATRLSKLWMHSCGVSAYVADEAVELLCCRVFLAGAAARIPPATGHSGFLRFLELLASFRFDECPIVITSAESDEAEAAGLLVKPDAEDVEVGAEAAAMGAMKRAAEAHAEHEKRKAADAGLISRSLEAFKARPAGVVPFITAPYDPDESVWTCGPRAIPPVVLARIVSLARRARDVLRDAPASGSSVEVIRGVFSATTPADLTLIIAKEFVRPVEPLALEGHRGR